MKILVLGGSGLIGTKVVKILQDGGHEAVPASPRSGVNALTGEGLATALTGVDVVVDVSNSPSFEAVAVMDFFTRSAANLLPAEIAAGVKHHVALSVVGADRMLGSGYMAAKVAQEQAIQASGVPYTIVRATQFFEFLSAVADGSTSGETVRLSPVLMQPIAADDVAALLAQTVVQPPVNGIVDIAGPQKRPIYQLVATVLQSKHDSRKIVVDPAIGYFGADVDDQSLVPLGEARTGDISLQRWLQR